MYGGVVDVGRCVEVLEVYTSDRGVRVLWSCVEVCGDIGGVWKCVLVLEMCGGVWRRIKVLELCGCMCCYEVCGESLFAAWIMGLPTFYHCFPSA